MKILFYFRFPNLSIAQFLLTHYGQWFDVNAVDTKHGNTPLHISCQNMSIDSLSIVQLLINYGAHVDSVNMRKRTPLELTLTTSAQTLLRKQQLPTRLKCLCARFVIEKQVPYESIWPKGTHMNDFIFLHGGLAKIG